MKSTIGFYFEIQEDQHTSCAFDYNQKHLRIRIKEYYERPYSVKGCHINLNPDQVKLLYKHLQRVFNRQET